MNRRQFLNYGAALPPAFEGKTLAAKDAGPEIAFTFDDSKAEMGAGLSWQEINERILRALAKYSVKSVLFVSGKRVDSDAGRTLIES
jgi:peptidoglycan/xylan/chitin deacetylase (PgdA/CDA1 family)